MSATWGGTKTGRETAGTSRRELIAGVAVVVIVGLLGVAIAQQGWRDRLPGTDVIPYIDAAHALLSEGRVPDRGVVTSFHSYAPPGLAWVVAPGMALLSEPRLFDAPGNALLYLGTLLGVFLLARACLGVRAGLLAVALYGLSMHGLEFAGSFGPRGHPLFYVWMAYWTCWWVRLKDDRYFAAALGTWLIGMYVFMELAPAVLMLPAVWIRYRPPVRLRSLAVAALAALVLWSPYLRFEAARDFADLRSQVLLQTIDEGSYAGALCNSRLALSHWRFPVPVRLNVITPEPAGGAMRFLFVSGRRALAIARGLVVNFEGFVPGPDLALLAAALAGLAALGLRRRDLTVGGRALEAGASRMPPAVLAGVLCTAAVLANEVFVDRLFRLPDGLPPHAVAAVRLVQAMLFAGALAMLVRPTIARLVESLARSRVPAPCDPRVLVLALVAPWALLLLLAESGRQDRLVGLWPLQAIALAFVLAATPAVRRGAGRVAWRLGQALLAGALVVNPLLVTHVGEWRHGGWSGVDAVEVRVADSLAKRMRSEGRNRAAIGRRLFLDAAPTPPWHAADSRWKVGGEFDILFEYRLGIDNLNRCVEGVTPQDEFRIVEALPPEPFAVHYFDVPTAGPLRLIDRIGQYEVYERAP